MSSPNKEVDFQAHYDRLIDRIQRAIGDQIGAAIKTASREYTKLLGEKAEGVFKLAVQRFYDSYHPKKYKRSRSMFNIFYKKTSDTQITIGFDPSKMTGSQEGKASAGVNGFYTSESGLFDQAFVKGWHGGSGSIDPAKVKTYGYGPHPRPGTPVWGSKAFGYWHWGEPANVESKSPYEEIREELEDNYPTSEDVASFERIANKELSKIKLPSDFWRR